VFTIISKNARIRYSYRIGEYSIIDDFCYFSVQLRIGRFFHIAPSVTIAGGSDLTFTAGDYGALASGVRVFCGSDDFVNDLGNILPSDMSDIKTNVMKGNVTLGNAVTIGANTVIMPDNKIPNGVCIGAMSFVPSRFKFEPWTVYAGSPKLRVIKKRNKENVLREIREIEKRVNK
jgi:acetyltransferase-like isoleucine patch superfamily enzyme